VDYEYLGNNKILFNLNLGNTLKTTFGINNAGEKECHIFCNVPNAYALFVISER